MGMGTSPPIACADTACCCPCLLPMGSPPNEQKLDSAAAKADTKEGYYIGRELPTSERNPLQGPNAWPDEALVPGYRRYCWGV